MRIQGVSSMFALRGVLRAESQEKILIYLALNESGYGSAISEFFSLSQNTVQKQLARLEEDGVIVGQSKGQMREYTFNPRYIFLEPLVELIKKAYQSYPQDVISDLVMKRKRPRKSGKALTTYNRGSNNRGNKA